MASQFQNRLVGTLVLVSLGVIFLPDVFDGEKTHYQENFQAIPLQEEFDQDLLTTELNRPKKADSYQPSPVDSAVSQPSPVDIAVSQPPPVDIAVAQPPPVDTTGSPPPKKTEIAVKEGYKDSAWVIRLGAFRNIDNAQSLVTKLRNKGYPAQLMPPHIKAGELARVEIGPDLSKEKLAAMTADIESLTGLTGQLLRFNPLNP